jgi:hypothetical protein
MFRTGFDKIDFLSWVNVGYGSMSYRFVAAFNTSYDNMAHTRSVKFLKMEEVTSPTGGIVHHLREVVPETIPLNGYRMYEPIDKDPYLRRVKMAFEEVEAVEHCYIWRVPWSVLYTVTGQWVPVIDANFPLEGEFTYRIQGDTRLAYEDRAAKHILFRMDMIRKLSAPPYLAYQVSRPLRNFLAQPLSSLATAPPQPPQQPQQPPRPPSFVADVMKADAIKKAGACPISLEPFTEATPMLMTPCFHIFSEDSLKEWLEKTALCPICKVSTSLTACV